jgi:hypothetical protein
MSDNRNVMERHCCIVDGRTYDVLVVYSPSGKFIDCTVTSPGGHCIKGHDRPIVACDRHSQAQVDAAIAGHYPGQETEEERD